MLGKAQLKSRNAFPNRIKWKKEKQPPNAILVAVRKKRKESKGLDDKKLGEKQVTKAQWHCLIRQNELKKDQRTYFDKWHLETENTSERESFLICILSV